MQFLERVHYSDHQQQNFVLNDLRLLHWNKLNFTAFKLFTLISHMVTTSQHFLRRLFKHAFMSSFPVEACKNRSHHTAFDCCQNHCDIFQNSPALCFQTNFSSCPMIWRSFNASLFSDALGVFAKFHCYDWVVKLLVHWDLGSDAMALRFIFWHDFLLLLTKSRGLVQLCKARYLNCCRSKCAHLDVLCSTQLLFCSARSHLCWNKKIKS